MRANGVPEQLCTGNADPYEKFLAWARTVPNTLRNPLYHWTHLELKRYFGVDELLDEKSAPRIWKKANKALSGSSLTTQGILRKFKVDTVCTTDDPTDDLGYHKQLAASNLKTRVLPAFRPDKALAIHQPEAFRAWLTRLETAADMQIQKVEDLMEALSRRHEFFHSMGCRLSDHGMNHAFAEPCDQKTAAKLFLAALRGQTASPEDCARFGTFMMLFFGHLDASKGWVKQLHLGALRNTNARLLKAAGPDTGFDSIGDFPQATTLARYMDMLDQENALPKTIIYNLNPADNYVFAAMIGNFQDGSVAGKIQFGSGWWFLDQKEGMEWQMNALSNLGLLSRFVGMVTDSRSFMSYPRHEYFRRVLCNLVGRDVENRELPDSDALLGPMIRNICYHNAKAYLNFPEKKPA
jgi:glucuronate isomerase